MTKFKIPKNSSGISKTLRFPEDIVNKIQNIADKKNLSFNRVVNEMVKFALDNMEE